MVHEQILKLLAKNSAQSPMTFADLLAISGLQPATLKMVLDQMYAAHSINQALVTRSGIIQREVWPTGMAKQLNAYADPSKRVAPTPLPPLPRRGEIKPKLMEETMLQDMTQDLEAASQTPKALTILKFIEANPNCNSAQISHATGIESPRSYIKAHISRGAVLVSGDNRKDMKMQLAAGRTAEAIYGNGYNKAKPAPSAALLAEVQAAHSNVDLPVGRVGFQPHAEPAPAVKFDADLGFYTDTDLIAKASLQQHIDALFMLLPDSATLCITRNDGQLEIDIEADVFGRTVAKSVQAHEVKQTLDALHIVTVEMA